MRRTSSRIALALSVTVIAWGCDSSTSTDDESITLSLSTNSLAMAQGGSQQITVTIQRSNFELPVTLSIQGPLPQGISAEFAQTSLPTGASTTLLTVEAAGNAAPTSSASFTVRAAGEGITGQTQDVTVSITVTGSYTLGLLEAELAVAQGGGGSATVLLTRNNGNAGDVALSVGALPAGVTATFAQATTTSGAGSLIVAADAGVAPGTYPIPITSSSPGHTPDQTTTLSLVVVSPPATASVNMVFCPSGLPTWFAYRNEGYGWQRADPAGSVFVFEATERVSVAFVFSGGGGSDFNIYHLERSEIGHFNDRDCPGTRSYTGVVGGLSSGQSALVGLGRSSDLPDAASPSYLLEGLPTRPLDLVAARGVVASGTFPSPDRLVIRRDVDLPTASVIPEVNFTAAESFAPATATASIANVTASSEIVLINSLVTANGTNALLQLAVAAASPLSLSFVPADRMLASDVHELWVRSLQSNGGIGQASVDYFASVGDRSVSLGPPLSSPTVTMVAGAHTRPRVTLASQAEYSTVALASFDQSSLSSSTIVTMVATAGHFGGTPTNWELAVPDFSGAAGFSDSWMLDRNVSVSYVAQAYGGPIDLLFGAAPQSGDSYRYAYRESPTTTAARLRGKGIRSERAPLPRHSRR